MANTTSRGNYYRRKTKEYFERLGYETQITEFMCGMPVAKNKIIYVKRDVFSSDGISMNGKEVIFWNSKHTTTGDISVEKSRGKSKFNSHKFPPTIKILLVIWQHRKKEPDIIEVKNEK